MTSKSPPLPRCGVAWIITLAVVLFVLTVMAGMAFLYYLAV